MVKSIDLSIAIHGLGGVGKTQIALAYAYKHKSLKTFEAILWVNSETVLSLASSFTRLAIVLGISKSGSHTDAENRVLVLSQLQKITLPWLLIFDNGEDPSLLQEFWPSTDHGSVLVTSRNHILAFTTFSSELEIETFGEQEGTDFLLSGFKDGRRKIPGEEKAAVQLVQKLGGHALGISQMAALMIYKGLTIAEFASIYDKRAKQIHRERRGARKSSEYLHYLDIVWKLSFDNLSEAKHASSFTILGVLSLMAPDLIPQDLFKHNQNLPNSLSFCEDAYRLVQAEFGYYVKPPNQQDIFTNASLLLSNAFPKQVNGRPMQRVWPTCALYISHVIELAKFYDSSSGILPTKDFCWLVSYPAWYLKEYGSILQTRFLVNVGFRAYENCGEKDRRVFLHLLNTIVVVYLERGNFQEAWKYLSTCESAILEIFGHNHEETSSNYNNLGFCCINLGKYREALEYLQLAEKIIREDETATPEGMRENIAGAVIPVGRAYWVLGDLAAAARYCEEALSYYEDVKTEWYLWACIHFLSSGIQRTNKEHEKAKASYNSAKKLLDEHKAHTHPFIEVGMGPQANTRRSYTLYHI